MAKWTKNQEEAIKLQDKNILVSASAGSGKTAVLVERVISKIINNKIDIDKIMVVTFTNAAANELKERLKKAIYQKLKEDPKNTFLKKQIRLLPNSNISTVDSFCIKLVRSNFNVLNIDPNFKICDNSTAEILKNKAMSNILEEEYIDSSVNENNVSLDLYKILEIFGGKDDNLISSLFRIYSYIQSFPYPFEYLSESIQKYDVEKNTDLINTEYGKEIFDNVIINLKSVLRRTELLRDEVAEFDEFKRHIELLDEDISILKVIINNVDTWDKLYNAVKECEISQNLKVKVSNEELKNKIKDFRNNIIKKEIDSAKKNVYYSSNEIINDNKIAYNYLKYLYSFLKKFDDEYVKLKQESNCLEFDDIKHLALKLLIIKNEDGSFKYSEIANSLKERFVEVYTDEYQDTNLVQETILKAVASESNRFMVGDVKQSIYKFIQARPDLFNEKYDTYELIKDDENESKNNVKIVLAENFRSRKEVLDSINYIFEQIMSKKVGDCEYSDIETLKNGANWYKSYEKQNYLTEVNIVDIEEQEEKKEDSDETLKEIMELTKFEKEAVCIAGRIVKLMKEFKVYYSEDDGKKEGFRDLTYSDIVILLRGIKNKGRILEEKLQEYGIPAFSDSSLSLFSSDELKLVISFLKIIDNQYQDVEMISVMYSIIGKFSLDDLCKIRLFFKDKTMTLYDNLKLFKEAYANVENVDNDTLQLLHKIDNFLELIHKFKSYAKVYSISEILIRMYKETNIYYQLDIQKLSDNKKANLNLVIDMAREFEQREGANIVSFLSYIDNVSKASTSESQAKVLGDNEDVVKIMTIHKSKGLEFPVVILADTASSYMQKDISNQVILHQKLGIGIDIVDEKYNISYPSVIKQAIKNVALQEIKSEELRILYVALTRAKEKLIIFGNINNYENSLNKDFVMYDNGKIDSTLILQNNSYLNNILLALKNYNNESNIFDFNVIKFDKEKMELLSEISRNTNSDLSIDNAVNKVKEKLENQGLNEKYDKTIIDCLNNNLNYKYEYSDDVITSNRVSVSKLKSDYVAQNYKNESFESENEEIQNIDEKYILKKFKIPETISNEEKYTPVRKGTLIHFVLETLDYNKINSKEELNEYIELMLEKGIINDRDKKYINVNLIYNFLISDIGKDIKKSNCVKKEEEFVVNLPKYSNSIIQGVIDLYYINERGNIILLDFKTDKIDNEDEFIKKYKIQLDIYKDALEILTDYKVEKKYIYSFYLNKEIEV